MSPPRGGCPGKVACTHETVADRWHATATRARYATPTCVHEQLWKNGQTLASHLSFDTFSCSCQLRLSTISLSNLRSEFSYLQRHVKGNVHWKINCARDANDYLYRVFSQRELVGLLSTSQYRKILTLRLWDNHVFRAVKSHRNTLAIKR